MGYIGVISDSPLILTFDPNFQRDIQAISQPSQPSHRLNLDFFSSALSYAHLTGFLLVLARICILRSPIAPYSKKNWVGSREWDVFANCGKLEDIKKQIKTL